MNKYTDDKLTRIIADDDKQNALAFEVLYERYATRLNSYCVFKSISSEDAEELFEDVWLKFLENIRKGVKVESVIAYLFTIARTLAIDRYRKENSRKNLKIEYMDATDIDSYLSQLDLYQEIENSNLMEIIRTSLDCLDDIYKETFVLQWFGGLNMKEIAEITGVSVSSVKMRSHRAMQKLTNILKPYINEEIN